MAAPLRANETVAARESWGDARVERKVQDHEARANQVVRQERIRS